MKRQSNSNKPILFFSTHSLNGWNGESILNHLKILETQSTNIHWLTNVTQTKSSYERYQQITNTQISGNLNLAWGYFDKIKAGKYKDWWQLYRNIDPRPVKNYSSLFIMGGLLSTGSQLGRYKKRAGIFPHDSGQMKFQSQSLNLINLLILLKAHHEYGIKLHEHAFDPLELSTCLFHKDVAPVSEYNLYHGYSDKKYNMHRLDSLQYYYNKTTQKQQADKTHDFVFGYTMLKDSGREKYESYINETLKSFPRNKRKLFVRDDAKAINTLVSKCEYMNWIRKAKFTIILPAYDASQFSIDRMINALQFDCLPIIHPDVIRTSVEKSFKTDLSVLTEFPSSERKRIELLNDMKKKFLLFKSTFRISH